METAGLDILIARHLDGSATEAERTALDAALCSDPQAARALARAARIDAGLRLLHQAVEAPSGSSITARIAYAEGRVAQRSALRSRLRPRRSVRFLPWLAMAASMLLAVGVWWAARSADSFTTGDSLAGTVTIPGGGSISLSAEAQARVEGGTEAPRLLLDRGRAACEVATRTGRPPFTVVLAQGEVRVVGTRFVVVAGPTARVTVERGEVEVLGQGRTERIGAGAIALLAAGEPPAAFRPLSRLINAAWSSSMPGHAAMPAGQGPTGVPSQRFTGGRDHWFRMLWQTTPEDWSRFQGLSLVLRGHGRFQIALGLDEVEDAERFVAGDLQPDATWREVRIPFEAFQRDKVFQPGLPNQVLMLDAVRGLAIHALEPIDLQVERVGLY